MSSIRIDHLPRGSGAHEEATSTFLARCLELRRSVFVLGQGIPAEREIDGLDSESEHFLAVSESAHGDRPLGTARLRFVPEGAKVERVAVLEEARETGLGRRLMQAVETRARELGLSGVLLHAQLPVVRFYEKLGYVAENGPFLEAGIPHRAMHKRLAGPPRP
jgi:predicted GNAT family N-acyltransferase